jgi:hypothetical protein
MSNLARQVEYDHLVSELVATGQSWEDAIEETNATFIDSNYNLASLFRYRNQEEFEMKRKVESAVQELERIANGIPTVNFVFALQGLVRNLQATQSSYEVVRIGTIRILERKSVFHIVLQALQALGKSDEEEEDEENSNGEDDDDEKDEIEENKVLSKLHLLSFLEILLDISPDCFLDYNSLFSMHEDEASLLKQLLDDDCGEAR